MLKDGQKDIITIKSNGNKQTYHVEREERNVFICNSTTWITTIQSAKYKIQDQSNRHISYIMYKTSINRANTTRSSHEIA